VFQPISNRGRACPRFLAEDIFEIIGLPAVAGFTVRFVRRMRSIVVAGVGLPGISVLTRAAPGRT